MGATNTAQRLDRLFGSLRDPSQPPVVMGVLNVTPDSFSDGGEFLDPSRAVEHAAGMAADGAAVVDVGAESTRPGSQAVSVGTQIDRAVPVIETVRQSLPDVVISIDTQSAEVAREAIAAGADMVNDISALRSDAGMARVVAGSNAGVVLMHMRGTPQTMQTAGGGPVYDNVVAEVRAFLGERLGAAKREGVREGRIIIDPGIGFGKTTAHNLALLREVSAFADLGVPLLVGASRKRFIGELTREKIAGNRLGGSLACVTAAVLGGASMVRVHDVAQSQQAVRLAHSLRMPLA